MSQIVLDAGLVYLAGLVARSGETVAEQTSDVLARIDELLAEAGTDKSRLLTATIWLRDIGTFEEMNRVWDAWVPEGCAPARACIETRFPLDSIRIEVQVLARQR
jgi:enamine deaminase RidA (YjgF/YER057c/UK114 family)